MATIGIKLVTLALIDKNFKIIAGEDGLSENGLYEVTDQELGTKTANITGIEGTPTVIYGNNTSVDVSTPSGQTKVAFDFNNLNEIVKQKILGRISDGKGGYLPTTNKPNVAALIKAPVVGTTQMVYYAFANGQMTEESHNLQTSTNAEQRSDDALVYNALAVPQWNGQSIKFFAEAFNGFDAAAMYKDVFGGVQYGTRPTTVAVTGATVNPGTPSA